MIKREGDPDFNVTMGSFYYAEICELDRIPANIFVKAQKRESNRGL